MKRIELKILGLSYSQSQVGSYVLVLSDEKGKRNLPLIIKPLEAQRIAIELEDIKSSRPLTHDLIKSINDSFNIDIQEVYIYELLEGIFHTKIILSNGIENVEIESTAGDAIALSVIYKCPIFISTSIMESAGILSEGEDEFVEDDEDDMYDYLISDIDDRITDLESKMNLAILNEDYEKAAKLRDDIKILKEK